MLIEKIRVNGPVRLVKQKSMILMSRIRGIFFRLVNVSGNSAPRLRVHEGVGCLSRELVIGRDVVIGAGCSFGGIGQIKLADNVVLNRNVHIDASLKIEIGTSTLVGPDCYFVDSNHVVFPGGPLQSANVESKPIIIGREVWFGRGVTVLPGVEIGEKSIVGAGSVVVCSIPARSVAVGVPAKVVKAIV